METAPLTLEVPSPHHRYHRLNPDGPPELSLLDDPDADIIIRSCDLQEVRVLKLYLTKSSPVLNELIQSFAIKFPDSPTSLHTTAHPCI